MFRQSKSNYDRAKMKCFVIRSERLIRSMFKPMRKFSDYEKRKKRKRKKELKLLKRSQQAGKRDTRKLLRSSLMASIV